MGPVDALTRLAHQAGLGDARALETFVETSFEPVWRLCATLVDPQSADDLAQETFARAVSALPGFRGASTARTWLLAIARHTCLDELRARGRRRSRDAAMANQYERFQSAHGSDVGDAMALTELVGGLELDRRTAFTLTQVLGLSYQEAAEVCDCPVGTVRSRVARARAELVELVHSSQDDQAARRSSSA